MRFLSFLLISLISISCVTTASDYNSYVAFNPEFKMGTELGNGDDESNNFMEAVFGDFRYRFSDRFAVSGAGSVGFTGSGKNLKFNHYYNRLFLKSSYFPLHFLSLSMEGMWAKEIDGNDNPVSVFQEGNYQAVEVAMEGITVFDVLYGRIDAPQVNPDAMITYKSGIKLGKYENSNFFSDIVLADINWRINNYFSIGGSISSGLTAPRNSFSEWDYFSTRLTGRLTIRPTKGMGYFIEGSYAQYNENNDSYSTYFANIPYISFGAKFEGYTFFKK